MTMSIHFLEIYLNQQFVYKFDSTKHLVFAFDSVYIYIYLHIS